MERVEIRFDPDRRSAKEQVQNLTLELCEKVLEAGCETANLQSGERSLVIVCNVQDASRAWSKMQDCLESRGLTRGTAAFVQRAEDEPMTQIYPL